MAVGLAPPLLAAFSLGVLVRRAAHEGSEDASGDQSGEGHAGEVGIDRPAFKSGKRSTEDTRRWTRAAGGSRCTAERLSRRADDDDGLENRLAFAGRRMLRRIAGLVAAAERRSLQGRATELRVTFGSLVPRLDLRPHARATASVVLVLEGFMNRMLRRILFVAPLMIGLGCGSGASTESPAAPEVEAATHDPAAHIVCDAEDPCPKGFVCVSHIRCAKVCKQDSDCPSGQTCRWQIGNTKFCSP